MPVACLVIEAARGGWSVTICVGRAAQTEIESAAVCATTAIIATAVAAGNAVCVSTAAAETARTGGKTAADVTATGMTAASAVTCRQSGSRAESEYCTGRKGR